MNEHDATEIAYRNGYEAGKRDAVKHGRWERVPNMRIPQKVCSVCHYVYITDELLDAGEYNYCCYCGALMDLEADGCT